MNGTRLAVPLLSIATTLLLVLTTTVVVVSAAETTTTTTTTLSPVYAQQQQPNQIKDGIKQRINESSKRDNENRNDFFKAMNLYRSKRNAYKREQRLRIGELVEDMREDNKFLRAFCRNHTNAECENETVKLTNVTTAKAQDIATDLATKTTRDAKKLLQKFIEQLSRGKAIHMNFQQELVYINSINNNNDTKNDLFGSDSYGRQRRRFEEFCDKQTAKLNKKLVRRKDFNERLQGHVIDLQKVLVDNICFELKNGIEQGELKGSKQHKFEQAVRIVLEDVLEEKGFDIDVLLVETVQKRFFVAADDKDGQRQLTATTTTTTTTTLGDDGTDSRRDLVDQTTNDNGDNGDNDGDGTQLVRMMLGFQCNCEEDDPLSDVFSDRRRRNLAEQGENGTNTKDKIEEMLQVFVEMIFGNGVTVDVVPCGTIYFNKNHRT